MKLNKKKLQPMICCCLTYFGFHTDPEKTIQENFNKAVNNNPSPLFEQPTNLAFHNLCSKNKLPTGTKELLGLNLSFCLASKQLQNNINHTIRKMAYSIRTRYFLQQNNVNSNKEYIKQLYIKNKNWDPPPASNLIETKITIFEKLLKEKHSMLVKKYKRYGVSACDGRMVPPQGNL